MRDFIKVAGSIRQKAAGEEGSFLSTAIFLAIIVIIMAIIIIDGSSVLYANRTANDGTEEAAELASDEWKLYKNEPRAVDAAAEYCEEKGLVFVEAHRQKELASNSFSVTCSKEAETYVFKRLPWLKDMIHQEATNVSFSST